MRRSIVASIGMVALVMALLMLQLTAPSTVGLFGVLIFFVLLYVFCGSALYVSLVTAVGILNQILPQSKWKLMAEGVSIVKIYYYSSILALMPVILLGMSSIGAVNPLDIALLVLFEVLGCFYISKRF